MRHKVSEFSCSIMNFMYKYTLFQQYCLIHLFIADVDECLLNFDECDENADCLNTNGSYDCSCRAGYRGTGFNCTSK